MLAIFISSTWQIPWFKFYILQFPLFFRIMLPPCTICCGVQSSPFCPSRSSFWKSLLDSEHHFLRGHKFYRTWLSSSFNKYTCINAYQCIFKWALLHLPLQLDEVFLDGERQWGCQQTQTQQPQKPGRYHPNTDRRLISCEFLHINRAGSYRVSQRSWRIIG